MTDDWKSKYDFVGPFSEGLARVLLNGKWGFVDQQGKEVIPLKYDRTEYFREGLAAVKLNGKYGYIDTKGKVIIPPKYVMAWSFSEGLAEVRLGDFETGKRGYVDKEGNECWDMTADAARRQMRNR